MKTILPEYVIGPKLNKVHLLADGFEAYPSKLMQGKGQVYYVKITETETGSMKVTIIYDFEREVWVSETETYTRPGA